MPPEPFDAIADLDLIDERQWPRLLELLGADPRALQALASGPDPSYSRWWLSRFARLEGVAPSRWRLPEAVQLTGLYDALPEGIDPVLARSIGVLGDGADALRTDPTELVARWSDPARPVPAGVVPVLTALVVEALEANPDVALPGSVRTLSGAVIDADDSAVIDLPWFAQLLDPSSTVAGGADPERVARVLDLDLASQRSPARFDLPAGAAGEPAPAVQAAVQRAALSLGVAPPAKWFLAVTELRVRLGSGDEQAVAWWPVAGADGAARGESAVLVTDGSADAVGRAVAWLAGRWTDRALAIAAARGGALLDAENGIS